MAALAAVMLVLAMVVGISLSLAPPTARAALTAFASVERAADMSVDEDESATVWIRPALSSKLSRQSSALLDPPTGQNPPILALLPRASEADPAIGAAIRANGNRVTHLAASGGLTSRIPTGPPAPASRAV
jgi:hypothetical protein